MAVIISSQFFVFAKSGDGVIAMDFAGHDVDWPIPFRLKDHRMTHFAKALPLPTAHASKGSPVANRAMFFRRWLANPLQMGSIIPSSPALCARVVRHTRRAPDEFVVELGAGTGVISAALLAGGMPPERLIVVEIVPAMAAHLRAVLPGVTVIEGDARDLKRLIPADWQGRIGTVVCGIPLVLLPKPMQASFITAIESVAPRRGFLHYSYCATSPLPARAHGLIGKREAWTPLNFPPASVWRYTPAQRTAKPG